MTLGSRTVSSLRSLLFFVMIAAAGVYFLVESQRAAIGEIVDAPVALLDSFLPPFEVFFDEWEIPREGPRIPPAPRNSPLAQAILAWAVSLEKTGPWRTGGSIPVQSNATIRGNGVTIHIFHPHTFAIGLRDAPAGLTERVFVAPLDEHDPVYLDLRAKLLAFRGDAYD